AGPELSRERGIVRVARALCRTRRHDHVRSRRRHRGDVALARAVGVEEPRASSRSRVVTRSGEDDSSERLRVGDARGATGAERALAQKLAEPVAGLDELALVTEQRVDLALER